jgi:hypothetical protein
LLSVNNVNKGKNEEKQWRKDKYKGIKVENKQQMCGMRCRKQTNKSQKDTSLNPGQIYMRTLQSAE